MGSYIGFIPSLLGIGTAGRGADYQASGVSPEQLQQAYQGSQGSIAKQQEFLNALQGQNGIGNQANVFSQQQALANQLGLQAQGGGPNPALAQLANTTGQNMQNQAALMAGQRGISANPGLAARQIGQQGAGIQQQAAGQAALQRAQQQLAAQQMLQQQQSGMAGLASQQVGQQAGALQGLGGMNLSNQQSLLNMQGNMNSANAGIAGINAKGQSDLLGGLVNGAGAMLMADGGAVPSLGVDYSMPQITNPFLGNYGVTDQNASNNKAAQNSGMQNMGQTLGSALGKGAKALFANSGAVVPGKAQTSGDSETNDKVPALLSPGEIVLPRSVTKAEDAPDKAEQFVAAILSRGKRK